MPTAAFLAKNDFILSTKCILLTISPLLKAVISYEI